MWEEYFAVVAWGVVLIVAAINDDVLKSMEEVNTSKHCEVDQENEVAYLGVQKNATSFVTYIKVNGNLTFTKDYF